jgi:hypothetical protein
MQHILKETIDFSVEKAVLFQFESRTKLAAYSVGIYCTLIELADTFYTLMKYGNYTGSLSIYRTFLENFVDLKNLEQNSNYVNQLDYDSFIQKRRLLKAAENDNPFCKILKKHSSENLLEIQLEIEKLKEGIDFQLCTTVKSKFVQAGMNQEYEGLYPTLSAESHCSLDAIFERHFDCDAVNNKVKLSINNKKRGSSYIFYLANMTNYLINAGILLSKILGGQQLEAFVLKREQVNVALQ